MQIIDKMTWTFSKENPPVCTIEPGTVLLFRTQDCFNGQISSESQLVHELDLTKANPAAGPVFVKGAEQGDTLAVDILDIQVGEVGFACSIPGAGPLSHKAEVRTRIFPVEDGTTRFNDVVWRIDPMVGVIGTAPLEGAIPCGFMGNHGGNIDSKHIKKGSRVYLPVNTAGALLQMGDIHASMGDGELCGTGIEIKGEITAKVSLIKGTTLFWPLTETADYWYMNTTSESYEDSLRFACEELARLACPAYGWDVTDFFIYLSLQGETALNQGVLPMAPKPMVNVRVGIPKLPDKKRLI